MLSVLIALPALAQDVPPEQIVPPPGAEEQQAPEAQPAPESGVTIPEQPQAGAAGPEATGSIVLSSQSDMELRGDWIIGAKVLSMTGESIGSITDVIVDAEGGRITAAVLSVGGFLGIGAKQVAVDWARLQVNWDASEILLELTREEAEAAPEYLFRERQYAPLPATAPSADAGAPAGAGGALN
jgi:sporulation protein YlmC with PRC-barrel domain